MLSHSTRESFLYPQGVILAHTHTHIYIYTHTQMCIHEHILYTTYAQARGIKCWATQPERASFIPKGLFSHVFKRLQPCRVQVKRTFVHVCVCVYIYIYTHTHPNDHIFILWPDLITYMHAYIHTYIHIYIYIYIYILCPDLITPIHPYVYIYIYTHTHTYIYIHTRKHTHRTLTFIHI